MSVQRLLLAAVILVCSTVPSYAQILYGGLVGNVTDESGAVIPGAQVTIINQQTGARRSGESNASGVYNFPTVATGLYTVEVSSDGFRTHSETGGRGCLVRWGHCRCV